MDTHHLCPVMQVENRVYRVDDMQAEEPESMHNPRDSRCPTFLGWAWMVCTHSSSSLSNWLYILIGNEVFTWACNNRSSLVIQVGWLERGTVGAGGWCQPVQLVTGKLLNQLSATLPKRGKWASSFTHHLNYSTSLVTTLSHPSHTWAPLPCYFFQSTTRFLRLYNYFLIYYLSFPLAHRFHKDKEFF